MIVQLPCGTIKHLEIMTQLIAEIVGITDDMNIAKDMISAVAKNGPIMQSFKHGVLSV